MSRTISKLAVLATGLFIATVAGCDAEKPQTKPSAKDSTAKESGKSAADTSGMKDLDDADRKLAEKQKVCPVSGGPLGAMGKPFKMTIKGRDFFLCCGDCKEAVEKDPDGILKKVDALLAGK